MPTASTARSPGRRGRRKTTGRYSTRAELETNVRFFYTYQSIAQVARTCHVSEATVAAVLRHPATKSSEGSQ